MRHHVTAFDLTSILEKGTFNMQFKELILRKQYTGIHLCQNNVTH